MVFKVSGSSGAALSCATSESLKRPNSDVAAALVALDHGQTVAAGDRVKVVGAERRGGPT